MCRLIGDASVIILYSQSFVNTFSKKVFWGLSEPPSVLHIRISLRLLLRVVDFSGVCPHLRYEDAVLAVALRDADVVAHVVGAEETADLDVILDPGHPGRNVQGERLFAAVHGHDVDLILILSRIDHIVMAGHQLHEGTSLQHRVTLMHTAEVIMELDQLEVLVAPRVRTAAVRLGPAGHAGFVAVVEGRCARPGHLHHRPQTIECRGNANIRSGRTARADAADGLVCPRHKAAVVMIRELVHRAENRVLRHAGHMVEDRVEEHLTVPAHRLVFRVGVLLHTGQEPGHRFHEGIVVHDGIPLVTLQPAERVAVVLGEDDGLRIRFFHHHAELLPEHVVVGRGVAEIGGDIETPAIDIIWCTHPLASDLEDRFCKLTGALIVQLRQGIIAPPLLVAVVVRPGFVTVIAERKIIVVRAVLALVRTRGISIGLILIVIEAGTVHPLVEGATVVEHTVDDDTHAAGMAGLDELDEELVAGLEVFTTRGADRVAGRTGVVVLPVLDEGAAVLHDLADMRIDVVVVLRIVLVVRRRHKKRVEVDDADAEALDIVELRAHAGEVTAVKPVYVECLDRGVPVLNTTRCSAEVDVFVVDDVIRRVAIAEAIDEDLVHDGTLRPVRDMESRHQAVREFTIHVVADAEAVEMQSLWALLDEKAVALGGLTDHNLMLIIVEACVTLDEPHLRAAVGFVEKDIDGIHVLPCCPKSERNGISRIRLLRDAVAGRPRGVQCRLVNRTLVHLLSYFPTDLFSVPGRTSRPGNLSISYVRSCPASIPLRAGCRHSENSLADARLSETEFTDRTLPHR